jgi:hypothetical protein
MTETRAIGQRAIVFGLLFAVLCLAYFLALDRVFFSSAGFSPIFRVLLTLDANTAWLAATICALAALWNRPEPILRFVQFLGERASWVALLCGLLFAAGAVLVYHNYPLSMDEYAAVFQSQTFASGRLYAQLPPGYVDWMVVRGFNGEFLLASRESGKVIEEYWPGFALLLAPFQFLQVPWLCNAALAGLALMLIHWITREVTGNARAAGWALLFAVASGAFVADAIAYYSMQAHLTANLLFAALLLHPSRYRALAAGLVGSLALILHNPLPHTLFAIPWLIAMSLERTQRRFLLPLILGYLPGICVAIGWLSLRSAVGSSAQNLSTLAATAGAFTWPSFRVLNIRAAAVAKMWVWAVPCLYVFAFLGWRRHREDLSVRLLAASAMLTFLGYLFVTFDQGHGWGNRYFHSAFGVIPILAACAMSDKSAVNPRIVAFAGAAALLNLMVVVPWQMHQIEATISTHLAQLGAPRRPGTTVYFIHPGGGFYVADLVQIDPLLRGPDLKLVSRGAELDAKMILSNWPQAIKVGGAAAYDQWYLGPADQRRAGSLTPPSAADH